jgi:hypothetical protein
MPVSLRKCISGRYSQHGEEGVIAAVLREIGVKSRTCVEFGAYDLREYSNVYSLWTAGWRALLIEANRGRYARIAKDYAAHPQAGQQRVSLANRFVTEDGLDSLDQILTEYGFPLDLDLVSIDVDGTDFHVWRGLRKFRPRLVVVEYNPTIPPHINVVGAARGNNVGCSVLALVELGRQKGYSLVACIGWNAFFVQHEHASLFADADDLENLFDAAYLRYAMQSYSGEVFFSAPLHLKYDPFCRDTVAIDASSVRLGRLGDSWARVGWHYWHRAERLGVAAVENLLPVEVVRGLRAVKRAGLPGWRRLKTR